MALASPSCSGESALGASHGTGAPETVAFVPRLFVLTILPHRRPPGNRFERVNGWQSMRMAAPRRIGLPYGVYPRLLLMFIDDAIEAFIPGLTDSPRRVLARAPIAHRNEQLQDEARKELLRSILDLSQDLLGQVCSNLLACALQSLLGCVEVTSSAITSGRLLGLAKLDKLRKLFQELEVDRGERNWKGGRYGQEMAPFRLPLADR